MTVSNTTRSVQYSGNGSTTAWPFSFLADADSLVVQLYDEELETLSTVESGDYSVAFTTTGFSAGTVTYPLSGSPLASTKKIVLSRVLSAVQTLSLGNQSTFYPALFEAALDRLVMLVQEVAERANRSLAVRVGEAAIAELATNAESRAERALMFDETGLILTAGPSAGEISSAGVAATSAATSAANALASEEECAAIQEDLETLLAEGMAASISFTPYEELDETDLQAVIEQLLDLVNDRVLEGTANQITVTNGDGVAGAPTVSLVLASAGEAETGTDENKVMTAARVVEAIEHRKRVYQVEDRKTSGTAGGGSTAATWVTRDLNTEAVDGIDGAALATNVVTLPAGRYHVTGWSVSYRSGGHRVRVYSVTGSAELLRGTSAYSATSADTSPTLSLLNGEVTLAVETEVRLDHWVANTRATDGFGQAVSDGGGEVYSMLRFEWLSNT